MALAAEREAALQALSRVREEAAAAQRAARRVQLREAEAEAHARGAIQRTLSAELRAAEAALADADEARGTARRCARQREGGPSGWARRWTQGAR